MYVILLDPFIKRDNEANCLRSQLAIHISHQPKVMHIVQY